MYSVWVRLQVLDGMLEDFEAAIAANALATVRDEPGCLYFDVVRLSEQGQWFGFYEIYESRSAFEVAHRSAPHYSAWRAAVDLTVVPGSQTITTGERTTASQGHAQG